MISRRDFLRIAPGIPWGLVGTATAAGAAVPPDAPIFRVATSSALLGDVNQNDARAAMRSWADVVSGMVGMPIDYDRYFLSQPGQLLEAMRTGAVDAVGCTTIDYIPFAQYVDTTAVLVDATAVGNQYLLLVNDASSFKTVADLRGRPLSLYRHPSTCLAMAWMETVLNASNLGPSERFFAAVTNNTKLSRTVLPVFFRQSDACLVTDRGFATMCELNPQLGKALRVVASSPRFLTSLMAFHRDCGPAVATKFRSALEGLTKNPTGKQLLALFQAQGFSTRNTSVLRNAVELVEAAERIRRRYPRARS